MSHITDAITGDTLMRTHISHTSETPKTPALELATLCSKVYESKRELQILSDTLSNIMGVLAEDNITISSSSNLEHRRITRERADLLVESFKQELLKHDSLIAKYNTLAHSHIPNTQRTPEE